MDACSTDNPIDRSNPVSEQRQALKRSLDHRLTSLSLVLPAFNEEAVIEQAIREAEAALSGLTNDYEILVVDDGSTDATHEIATRLAEKLPAVRVLKQPKNIGYGAALRRGFEAARKELVGFTDSDCQFDLTELDRLVMLAQDYDIVCGYRIDRKDTALRCFYSNGYNALVRTLLGTGVRDCDCALKLFRRDVLVDLPITTDGFLVNSEMLCRARAADKTIVEVGVSHRPRAAGNSKVSVGHVIPVFAAMICFWWNFTLFAGKKEEATPDEKRWGLKKQSLAAGGLLLLCLGLLVARLNYPLIEPDETRYAQIPLEMVETGDWLVPRLQGKPYLDKPPLLYWATAVSYQLFGVNETSARLPIALSALLTVLTLFLLGRRIVGDRAAFAGALMLLLCAGFILSGRFLLLDGALTLFTTVALLSAANAIYASATERSRTLWWIAAGTACGLGLMVKGPIAGVLCAPPVIVLAWLTGLKSVFRWRTLLAVALPMLAISVPWFVLVSASQAEFGGHFFWTHHIVRFLKAFNHQQPWWYYIPVIAAGMFPISLLLPAFMVYLFKRKKACETKRIPQLGFLLLAGVWVIGFFSLSSCKLPTYILPAIPMLALAMAKMMDDMTWPLGDISLVKKQAERSAYHAVNVLLWIAGLAGIADLALRNPGPAGAVVAIGLIVFAVIALFFRYRSSTLPKPWLSTAVLTLVVSGYVFGHIVPEFAGWRSIAREASLVQQQVGEKTPVVFYNRSKDAATFEIKHSDVMAFEIEQAAAFQEYMEAHPIAVIVTNNEGAEELESACENAIYFQQQDTRGKVFIAKQRATSSARNSNGTLQK